MRFRGGPGSKPPASAAAAAAAAAATTTTAATTATAIASGVVSFGIAKRMDEVDMMHTTIGAFPGTRRYMGPLAISHTLDPRIDLWCMGLVIAESLLLKFPTAVAYDGMKFGAADVSVMAALMNDITARHAPAGHAAAGSGGGGGGSSGSELDQLKSAITTALAVPQDTGFHTAKGFMLVLSAGNRDRDGGNTTNLGDVIHQSQAAPWAFTRRIKGLHWTQESESRSTAISPTKKVM